MAIGLDQFVANLTRSGLMSAADVAAFQEGFPPEKRPKDALALARELVLAEKLTKYQATLLYEGKTKGLVIGEYLVLDKLGQGGMGVVLKAQHRRLKRLVAVKVLPTGSMKSPEAVRRFRREVEAAGRLTHSNIVTAYDASEQDRVHYLAMEYVEGKDLGNVVKERGPLDVRQALDCTLQTARGLAYAHAEGVVHRDIKPSNLLLDRKGTVKILDMGLARIRQAVGSRDPDSDRLTAQGEVMGTCDYMAPEQAEDTHRADHRADIYSLGCTLFRLLTGRPPYARETLVQILLAHRDSPIPSLRAVRPEVPEAVEAIYRKMVAKRAEDRYQSMAEVVADMEACLGIGFGASAGTTKDESATLPPFHPLRENLSVPGEKPPGSSAVKPRAVTVAEETLPSARHEDTGRALLRYRAFRHGTRGSSREQSRSVWAADATVGRFAIAQGSDDSLFGITWAQLLAQQFVQATNVPPQRLRDWLPPAQEEWSDQVRSLEVPWDSGANPEQGALAGFLGLLVTPDEGTSYRWQAVAVGHSCLFHVRGDALLCAFPLARSEDFHRLPRLVGPLMPLAQLDPTLAAGTGSPGDCLWMTTAALAQWFVWECERGNRPWKETQWLRESPVTKARFAAWIDRLRAADRLRDEDVVLAVVCL